VIWVCGFLWALRTGVTSYSKASISDASPARRSAIKEHKRQGENYS